MTALYLTDPGTVVRCQNAQLAIALRGKVREIRLAELSLVVVMPGVQLTSVVMAELLDRGIETIFLRQDGQFRGRLQGHFPTNPTVRLAQYQTADSYFGLAIARKLVTGKIRNQRANLQRRNRETGGTIGELSEAIDAIAAYLTRLQRTEETLERETLMGIEGTAARAYYQALRHWFPPQWNFTDRNRQPPRDPVNALLSWGYGVLLARVFSACVQAGLDPYLGFFHATQPYRPNLALDLMEEFRPVVVDRAAIAIVQAGLIAPEDFQPSPDGMGVWLGNLVKRLYLAELERQLGQAVTYEPQGRRLKVSQVLLEQARSLGRCLVNRTLDYEPFVLR